MNTWFSVSVDIYIEIEMKCVYGCVRVHTDIHVYFFIHIFSTCVY